MYIYVQYVKMEGGITGYIVFNERKMVVEEYVQKTQYGAERRRSETEQERRLNHKRRGKIEKIVEEKINVGEEGNKTEKIWNGMEMENKEKVEKEGNGKGE
jgi:hypothetical protein